jgi:hypothetical protein
MGQIWFHITPLCNRAIYRANYRAKFKLILGCIAICRDLFCARFWRDSSFWRDLGVKCGEGRDLWKISGIKILVRGKIEKEDRVRSKNQVPDNIFVSVPLLLSFPDLQQF